MNFAQPKQRYVSNFIRQTEFYEMNYARLILRGKKFSLHTLFCLVITKAL